MYCYKGKYGTLLNTYIFFSRIPIFKILWLKKFSTMELTDFTDLSDYFSTPCKDWPINSIDCVDTCSSSTIDNFCSSSTIDNFCCSNGNQSQVVDVTNPVFSVEGINVPIFNENINQIFIYNPDAYFVGVPTTEIPPTSPSTTTSPSPPNSPSPPTTTTTTTTTISPSPKTRINYEKRRRQEINRELKLIRTVVPELHKTNRRICTRAILQETFKHITVLNNEISRLTMITNTLNNEISRLNEVKGKKQKKPRRQKIIDMPF